MRNFARLPGSDRAALFNEAASRSGLPIAIVEKDFWVCWMLDRMWASSFASSLIFKGGTSLSKCFGLIERFSEDIDIGLDRKFLGFGGTADPAAEGLSRKARNKRVDCLKAAAKSWIETSFLDELTGSISSDLGEGSEAGWAWEMEADTDGVPKLRWKPPVSRSTRRGNQTDFPVSYLNRGVLIEIGSRAAHWPATIHQVAPYIAQHIPEAFSVPATAICTLDAARTFWEKATILHVLYHETELSLTGNRAPKERERFSRHCYDLHCLARSAHGEEMMKAHDLLADVVRFKSTFFCSSNVKEDLYNDAVPGSFHLLPHAALESFLAADYAKMQSSGMFFGEAPTWSQIHETLQETQKRINEE